MAHRISTEDEVRRGNAMRRWIWVRLKAGDARVVDRLLQYAAGKNPDRTRLCEEEIGVVLNATEWVARFAARYAERRPHWLPTAGNIASAIRHSLTKPRG